MSQLLIAWGRSELAALEELTPRVYHELHKLAPAFLRRGKFRAVAASLVWLAFEG